MKNKLLNAVKDEYAKYTLSPNWGHFIHDVDFSPSDWDEVIDEIATRYAAKENEGLIRDVRELRRRLIHFRDGVPAYPPFIEKVNAIIDKTAHYDNQNTDV